MTRIARSAVFIGFDRLCHEHGVNPHTVLLRCGLDPLVLRRADLYLPYARFAQALTIAAAEGNCPSFGLRLSEHHDYLVLGPFGLLLAQAQSFSEVLRLTQQYVHLHAQGIALSAQQEGDHLAVEYRLELPEANDLRQLLELGLGVVHRSMHSLFGEQWQPLEVSMRHACMGQQEDYTRFFGCPVRFDQPRDGIRAGAHTLNLRPLEQRPQLKTHLLEEYAHRHQIPGDLASRVRLILQSILSTGEASLEVVARLLGQHPRSLQYALQQQSLSFRQLLDEVRYNEARQQLQLSRQSITDLALHLGYADETAFSRAFKRWSGLPPRLWREQSRSGDPTIASALPEPDRQR